MRTRATVLAYASLSRDPHVEMSLTRPPPSGLLSDNAPGSVSPISLANI